MFLEYFRLREQPFGVTPDPRYLFPSPGHREALASLVYGIESNLGFGALLAEPGMGKTTLLYHILERYRHTARTAFIFNTQCNSYDLLQSFLTELDEKHVQRDTFQLHERLKQILAREAQAKRRVLLVIDEAQNLGDVVMETVRLLSNFESADSKLLHIILAGQPELATKLGGSNLSQLLQRIPILTYLKRLTPEEVAAYIEHRLRVAGSPPRPLFRPETIEYIARLSRGVPREINRLCFNCLSLAFASSKPAVDLEVIEEVASDLDLTAHVQKREEAAIESRRPLAAAAPLVDRPLPFPESSSLVERPVAEPIKPVARPSLEPVAPAPTSSTRAAGTHSRQASPPPQRRTPPSRPSPALSYRRSTRAGPFAWAVLYLGVVVAGFVGVTRWLYPDESATAQPANEPESVLATDPDNPSPPVPDLPPAGNDTPYQGTPPEETYERPRKQSMPSLERRRNKGSFGVKSQDPDVVVRNFTRERSAAKSKLKPSIHTDAGEELLAFVPVRYPETAVDRHIEGTVVLSAMVSRDGTITSIRPVSGDPLLLSAASTAVRGWVYRPQRINGTAAAVGKQIVISFSLSKNSNP